MWLKSQTKNITDKPKGKRAITLNTIITYSLQEFL